MLDLGLAEEVRQGEGGHFLNADSLVQQTGVVVLGSDGELEAAGGVCYGGFDDLRTISEADKIVTEEVGVLWVRFHAEELGLWKSCCEGECGQANVGTEIDDHFGRCLEAICWKVIDTEAQHFMKNEDIAAIASQPEQGLQRAKLNLCMQDAPWAVVLKMKPNGLNQQR
jgi:hypothetical protein